ncbi:cyclase family protein [Aestuariibaculum sediminum]|uniref:Cyclase family protein n=1 Tax=Aestuariibaculum sediminum TaxID=2770637 RepID=A0A8J6Q139_9FLAO|nr:cyclase family protein [Aestuariibaculum sediminum]MBD0830875.1 cyclase family protein [Aestuariibaculum sediminum]
MIATIQYNSRKLQIDLAKPQDISIPIKEHPTVSAWYVDPPKIEPVVMDDKWVGLVSEGAAVNFNNVWFNPHAHGTHTECAGHITETVYSINKHLKEFFFLAELITVAPEKKGDDFMISKKQIQFALGNKKRDAVIIRTLPNTKEKKSRQYSNTNPTYLQEEAAIYLKEKGIKHLLVDMPSVDKERDNGELLAHHAFWDTKGELRLDATITELIYVPNAVKDGEYMLNLQIASFENDAVPSKPVLYKIIE